MKNKSLLLTILACVAILYGLFSVIGGVAAPSEVKPAEDLSQIGVVDIQGYRVLHIENLQVVERYAFRTADEYHDTDGYSEITYRVYEGDEPMDEHELDVEYYTVVFSDNTGKSYVASMSVAAKEGMSDTLNKAPVTVSAVVGASPLVKGGLLNSWDEEQIALRESHLNAYAAEHELPRAGITLGYQDATIEAYQQHAAEQNASDKSVFSVGGVILLAGGVALLIRSLRKKKTEANDQ